MTDRHYGNDVPTGPIPVIPPQSAADSPLPVRPPAIPEQRREPTTSDEPVPAEPRRRRWLWAVLVVLIALALVVVVLVAQGGVALIFG
ncbi:hypothetical protein ACQEVB_27535 [Pseudonocardia sp. CA-107938]|uniref:hypothetical protein n=1 Tax=Pseudonocardia sp. CA-107938 TaxID=3240021 RepID=UPI003D943049